MPADRAQANQGVGKVPKPIPASLRDTPARNLGNHCREWPACETVRDQASRSRRQQTARPHSEHWWLSHQRVGLRCQTGCYHHPRRQCSLYGLKLQLDKGGGSSHTYAIRWIASRGRTTHAIVLTDSMSLLQKVKNGMGSPDCNVSVVDIHLLTLLWMYWPGHAGVKGNDGADTLSGKATLTSGLLFDLKCWGAWDTTCRHNAKNITPSIAWRREPWKEEALDDLESRA